MKNTFIGYDKKSKKEIESLWKNAYFSFDANVLLNLYRYSETSKDTILNLITKFSSRIFLTHQAGSEFHQHRFDVIYEQAKAYQDFLNDITKNIESKLETKTHPFLSPKLELEFKHILEKVKNEVNHNKEHYNNLFQHDDIYEKLKQLFDGKIEKPFNSEELKDIYLEGKTRFEKKIPPGFEDAKDKEGDNKYGDLVLWKQIIEKAKTTNKPIILITDDAKKDWWWTTKSGDRKIGPRPELIEEIKKETKVDFHLYSSDNFVTYGLEYLKESSKPDVVAEIKELKQKNIEKIQELELFAKSLLESENNQNNLSRELLYLQREKNDLKHKLQYLHGKERLTEESIIELGRIRKKINEINNQMDIIRFRLTGATIDYTNE